MSDTAEGIVRALLKAWHEGGDSAVAVILEELARATGRNAFRHAGQIVRGRRGGRRETDDREALARIAAYPPDRRHTAVGAVARQIAGGNTRKARAMEHRLREKLRKIAAKFSEETDASADVSA